MRLYGRDLDSNVSGRKQRQWHVNILICEEGEFQRLDEKCVVGILCDASLCGSECDEYKVNVFAEQATLKNTLALHAPTPTASSPSSRLALPNRWGTHTFKEHCVPVLTATPTNTPI